MIVHCCLETHRGKCPRRTRGCYEYRHKLNSADTGFFHRTFPRSSYVPHEDKVLSYVRERLQQDRYPDGTEREQCPS